MGGPRSSPEGDKCVQNFSYKTRMEATLGIGGGGGGNIEVVWRRMGTSGVLLSTWQ